MIIYVTGGIASGKSSLIDALKNNLEIAEHFEFASVDQICRDQWKQTYFQRMILETFGCLGRQEYLKQLSEKTPEEFLLAVQEVNDTIQNRVHNALYPFLQRKSAIIEFPTLFEHSHYFRSTAGKRSASSIIVNVEIDPDVQLGRLMTRNNLEIEQARRLINLQVSPELRRALSTVTLDGTDINIASGRLISFLGDYINAE